MYDGTGRSLEQASKANSWWPYLYCWPVSVEGVREREKGGGGGGDEREREGGGRKRGERELHFYYFVDPLPVMIISKYI